MVNAPFFGELLPPWEGSKIDFKNLKKSHNDCSVECHQETPGEHNFSKKVKFWPALSYYHESITKRDLSINNIEHNINDYLKNIDHSRFTNEDKTLFIIYY